MQSQVMSTISSTIIQYIWSNKTSKNRNMGTLLDPINTAVCLCLLNHYPEGTKISIQNNEITFQEPGSTQGIYRWTQGDRFDHLHNLINPIKKMLEKKSEQDLWGEDNKNFTYLCHSMQSGLSRLAETYKDNMIAKHTLEFYKSLIGDSLQNKTHFLEKLNTDMEEYKLNYDIYQEFFEDWNKDHIGVMVMLLENIGMETRAEVKNAYKKSLQTIVDSHNERIKNIIYKVQSGVV